MVKSAMMKSILCLSTLLIASCGSSVAERIEIKQAIAVPQKPYESCYPSNHSKPTKVISVVSKTDGQTYWEVEAPAKVERGTTTLIIGFNIRTNQYGKCQLLEGSFPEHRLNFMPEDAAIALAKLQYEPYLNKFLKTCVVKASKEACLRKFSAHFNQSHDMKDDMRSILPPEDVKALKELGLNVKPRKNEDPYLEIKRKQSNQK
jgi:hypothetical protein